MTDLPGERGAFLPARRESGFRVVLVGAAGVFGSRLARQLAAEPGIGLVLAGRRREPLQHLAETLDGGPEIALVDRETLDAAALRALGADCVIDAAGPFQASGTALVEAGIGAGCHVVDLADARAWVAGIGRFDAAARAAGVVVAAGASSTPALSHAALDRLVAGWRSIDRIVVAISPGNRAPRGLSVFQAILSYTGKPVRVFRGGAWTVGTGWGSTRRLDFPGIGPRLVSLCETPDLDLLVSRFGPRESAEFLAGLELGFLHRGLELAALPVRLGLLPSLVPLARPFRWIASLFESRGTDRGGMLVAASGRDDDDGPRKARWWLRATGGRGPHVPTLPALALVRRLRDGSGLEPGARACVGMLALDDFAADFARLGIETGMSRTGS
jgi:hypothetical protein